MNLPTIIQGGMGVGVSDWRLANAVARAGQLGVVRDGHVLLPDFRPRFAYALAAYSASLRRISKRPRSGSDSSSSFRI